MRYEWDYAKDLRNQQNHDGVSFQLATGVFEDEHCFIVPDRTDGRTGEQRWHAIGAVHDELESVAVLLAVHVYRNNLMTKKLTASSQPERLKSMSSADIANRRLTDRERQTLRRIGARQTEGDDSRINLEDIPRLSDQQLAGIIRLRDIRPRKTAVSVRLDARVLEWLRSKGGGHLTLINDILANIMEAEQRTEEKR